MAVIYSQKTGTFMTKKGSLIIYIAMIIVGIFGLFLYIEPSKDKDDNAYASTPKKIEKLQVAVLQRDIPEKTILKRSDFIIKDVLPEEVDKKNYLNVTNELPINWAVNTSLPADSYILANNAVKPGSDEYLSMFLQAGNVLYPFKLDARDSYLLNNIKPGSGVDIYLSYSRKTGNDGRPEIVSPPHSIEDSRLKPILKNKRVLAIRTETAINSTAELILEMQDKDIKIIKGLEVGNAKLVLFPADTSVRGKEYDHIRKGITPYEKNWPESDDAIFGSSMSGVTELRG